VPYYDEKAKEETGEIGDVISRTFKDKTTENKVCYYYRQSAFERVAQEVDYTYFPPESSGHIHSAGVATSYVSYVRFFKVGYEHGEVKTTYKIRHYCAEQKPVPRICNA
jgi:hypothetical protein